MSARGMQELHNEELLFSVYDSKSESFSALIACKNIEVLKRRIKNHLLKDPDSVYVRYCEDFSLYLVGRWCSLTGFMYGDLSFICELSEVLNEGGEL